MKHLILIASLIVLGIAMTSCDPETLELLEQDCGTVITRGYGSTYWVSLDNGYIYQVNYSEYSKSLPGTYQCFSKYIQ